MTSTETASSFIWGDNTRDIEKMVSTCPYPILEAKRHLPFDCDKSVQLEIPYTDQPLFSYVLRFISKRVKTACSIRANMGKGKLGMPLYVADDEALEDLMMYG